MFLESYYFMIIKDNKTTWNIYGIDKMHALKHFKFPRHSFTHCALSLAISQIVLFL